MKLELQGVSKAYRTRDGELSVLQNINLSGAEGDFISLIGPSGCGKSTLFNLISGLEAPDEGTINLDGHKINGRAGHVSYMLQKDCLFPWRTVVDNAILGAEVLGRPRKEAKKEVEELLPVFGLDSFADEYPTKLSGGMRQRAALLRTVMTGHNVWLLDEPLGALDALTRERMQTWLLEICARFRPTVLFITHNIEEAVFLSDRVCVLSDRPARILEEIPIELPRPRERTMVTDSQFIGYKEKLLGHLFGQDK